MSRFERNIWFERLVALRNDYGQWVDDTEPVISIADVIAYAEAVLAATELADELAPVDADETVTAYWPDGTPVAIDEAPRTAAASQPGPSSRDAADGRPRIGRFFHLPTDADGSDPS